MEWNDRIDAVQVFFRKYKWMLVLLIVGILILVTPEKSNTEHKADEPVQVHQDISLQQELENLLSQMENAGKVKVLLSVARDAETLYYTDSEKRKTDTSEEISSETVLITDSDRNQTGLIRRIDPPVYLGAVVLCQGAGSAQVRLAVVDAVATATGLTSDKISVWKMK